MGKYLFILLAFYSFISCNSEKTVSGYLKTDDAKIFYTEIGKGDTTLFFLHGWDINSTYWNEQQNYFSKNYKTIAIDLPGFGKSTSSRKDFTIENYADDLIDVIKKLELNNVILIGHSMSGDIILETALKNNKAVIGVVGVDNFKFVGVQLTPEQSNEMNLFVDTLKKDYRNTAPEYAARFLFSPTTDSSVKSRVKNDYRNSDPAAAVSSIRSAFSYNENEKLPMLKLKLYLINSDGMPTNKEGLAKYCRNSFDVLEIHGTGHFPMIEKPDEFNRKLQLALNKIGSKL